MGYRYTDDATWINDIKSGDKRAFEHLFKSYHSNLCAYVTALSVDPSLAKDVVQDVFINLWNHKHKIVLTTSLKSYLYKSCYHKYIDEYRKLKQSRKKLEEVRQRK